MRPFVCKRDGMWVVTSREGQRRYLSLRWAMKHARTVAKRKPRTLEGAPYVWFPPEREAGIWGAWETDAAASQPPFEGRFATGDMGHELRRLGFVGGVLDGSDPDWQILDPGYPHNRTAPTYRPLPHVWDDRPEVAA